LRNVLHTRSERDTVRFDVLINLVKAIRIEFPDSAISYCNDARILAIELEDKTREIQSWTVLGTALFYKGQYDRAEEAHLKAIGLSIRYGIDAFHPNALASLALVLQNQGRYSEALEAYFEALEREEKRSNQKEVIKVLLNLAILYRNLGDYDNTIRYAERAYGIIKSSSKSTDQQMASATTTIGLTYLDLDQYDSALLYLKESYKANRRMRNVTYTANSESNISFCYQQLNRFDSAGKYVERAFLAVPQISNHLVLSTIYINMGSVRLKQNRIDDALMYTQQGVLLASQVKAPAEKLQGYLTLASIYKRKGNFSLAYEFTSRAYQLNDSLKISDAQREAANIQRDYEIQKKQQRIDLLGQQAGLNEKQLKSEQRVSYYLSISVGLLVLTVVLAYYGLRVKVRSHKRLQAKSNEIAQKNDLLESANRGLQDQALRTQMKPHFIFNALNSIQYLILQKENEKAFEYLSKFSQLLRSALEFSDQNFIELEKELMWLDLYVKLESLRFNHEFDFSIAYQTPKEEFRNLQLPPFLIQPFIENAIAHGLMPKTSDRMLRILLSRSNGTMTIQIADNGIGRSKAAEKKLGKEKRRSFGVELVNKRLEILKNVSGKNYECKIEDGKDEQGSVQGTLVTLILPI
jgi:tetratricopeptide (TPR) repeat protein